MFSFSWSSINSSLVRWGKVNYLKDFKTYPKEPWLGANFLTVFWHYLVIGIFQRNIFQIIFHYLTTELRSMLRSTVAESNICKKLYFKAQVRVTLWVDEKSLLYCTWIPYHQEEKLFPQRSSLYPETCPNNKTKSIKDLWSYQYFSLMVVTIYLSYAVRNPCFINPNKILGSMNAFSNESRSSAVKP